jgi:hypothetical protein
MDNLSTHTGSRLTDRYGLEIGKGLWDRFTVHYTPCAWKLAEPGGN